MPAGVMVSRGHALPCLLLLSAVLAAPVPAADDAAARTRQLEALRSRIAELQKTLGTTRHRKSRAEQQLRSVERAIGATVRGLRDIDRRLGASRRQLRDLERRRDRQQVRLAALRKRLAREARAAYAMGRQQQVKLLLNQQQPERIGRMLVYFGYLTDARARRIAELREGIARLRLTEASIAATTRELETLRQRRRAGQAELESNKRERKALVAALARQLDSGVSELKRLGEDEKRLQALIRSLQDVLADIPSGLDRQRPFRDLKGNMRWPARGALVLGFGEQRGGGGLRSRGVVIAAPEGGEVRAVSHGRVAFADWLRGFGLLLIIDHGDGYMSLYGHNQALYKEVGEWVDTGEVVAVLGASGGSATPGLYFELRHKGRPVNPLKWCAGRPRPAG